MTKATDPALEQTAVASPALAATAASSPSAPPGTPEHVVAPGAMIGRYQVESTLGAGGMGVVYVARDPQLDRNVALKVVRSDQFSDEQVRARLSREARAMAKVRHAGVVTVYDAGELPDGVFIAMELVEGTTLARWLAERARPWPEVVRMFVAVGRGLAAAHAAGVVHRDFKPANVLVDASGRPAVTDFGIALVPAGQAIDDAAAPAEPDSAAEARVPSALSLTRTGVLAGTPSYMSPEQFRTGAVDARSDQYSFGVALFEALYRVHPFGGNTTEELRIAVMRGVLRLPPRDSTVPAGVRRVVERVLRTDPTERFPDMPALLDELEATLRPRWRRWAIAGAASVAVLAIGGGAYALRRAPEPARAPAPVRAGSAVGAGSAADTGSAANAPVRRTAVLIAPFANHTGDARLDDTLDLVVGEVLSRSTKIDQASGAPYHRLAQRLGLPPHDVDGIAAKFAQGDPRPVATVAGTIDRDGDGLVLAADLRVGSNAPVHVTERATGLDDASAAAVRLGGKLAAAFGDPLPPALLDHVMSRSLDALHAFSQGHAMALDNAGSAVDFLDRAAHIDPTFVEAQAVLGTTLSNLGRPADAAVQFEMALRNADALSERNRLMIVGDYDDSLGKYDQAIAAYEHLLAKWPGDSRAEVNVAAIAIEAHDWPLALELARRAAADFPELAVVRANLVLAELGGERIADAARDGSAMLAALPHPTDFGIAATAVADELAGQRDAARTTFDRITPDDPEMAARARADLALYEGRLDDAEHELTSLLARGSADFNQAMDEIALAQLRLRRGDGRGATAAARIAARAIAPSELNVGVYVIASANVATGDLAHAPALIRAWSDKPGTDARVFAKLLEGDLAFAKHHPADALAAYVAASEIGATWLVHARLERGYAATGDHVAAAREAAWCIEHRGEAATTMTPSLSLLPELYLARAKELAASGAPAAAVTAAYRDAAALAPAAQRDPLTDAARAGAR